MTFKYTKITIETTACKTFNFVRNDELGNFVSIQDDKENELMHLEYSELVKIVERLKDEYGF